MARSAPNGDGGELRQFDVFRNPSAESAARAPYLLIISSDLYRTAEIAVVVPLLPLGALEPIRRLNPQIIVEGRTVIFSGFDIANMPPKLLGPVVANLETERDRIIAALDLLFTGV